MPIPTPEPPVKRLAEEVAYVRVAGGRPRVHGNGFIQLDLSAARRLHVWGDPRIPRQAVPSQIHDHTFSFTSTIMSGQLVHRAFAVTNAVDGAYRLYHAVTRHGEDTRLVEQPGRYLALIAEERLLRAGDAYTFAAGQFHETVAPWPCVTIIEKDGPSLAQGGPSPRVLVPADLTPDNEFDRYGCASTDLLWQVIDDALAGRSEVEALLLQRAQEIEQVKAERDAAYDRGYVDGLDECEGDPRVEQIEAGFRAIQEATNGEYSREDHIVLGALQAGREFAVRLARRETHIQQLIKEAADAALVSRAPQPAGLMIHSESSEILAWLNAEQTKAERWGYSRGNTGVFRFGLTGPELMRIRAALGAPKERLYHEITCPTLTKSGPCNCTTQIIVADQPAVPLPASAALQDLTPERLDAAVSFVEALQRSGVFLHDASGKALDRETFCSVVAAALQGIAIPHQDHKDNVSEG